MNEKLSERIKTAEDYATDYMNDAADMYSHEILTKHFQTCIDEVAKRASSSALLYALRSRGARQKGNPMKLFLIQDSDRPIYVIAKDWQEALDKWKKKICEENETEDPDEPSGIQIVASEDDVLQ